MAKTQRLDEVPLQCHYTVAAVHAPQAADRVRQLEEIGFFPGEQVMVTARGVPGGDPLVVRVGQSTFALRRAEAACISVQAVEAAHE